MLILIDSRQVTERGRERQRQKELSRLIHARQCLPCRESADPGLGSIVPRPIPGLLRLLPALLLALVPIAVAFADRGLVFSSDLSGDRDNPPLSSLVSISFCPLTSTVVGTGGRVRGVGGGGRGMRSSTRERKARQANRTTLRKPPTLHSQNTHRSARARSHEQSAPPR